MNMLRWTRMLLLVAVGLICTPLCAQSETPLGDIVKQKPAKKAARVITDDDMPQRPPAPPASVQDTQAADAKSDNGKAANAVSPAGNAVLQKQISELKALEEAKKATIKRFEEGLKEENIGDLRREIYGDSIRRAKEQLAAYEKERTLLEQTAAEQNARQQHSEGQEPKNGEEKTTPAKPAETAPGAPSGADGGAR